MLRIVMVHNCSPTPITLERNELIGYQENVIDFVVFEAGHQLSLRQQPLQTCSGAGAITNKNHPVLHLVWKRLSSGQPR